MKNQVEKKWKNGSWAYASKGILADPTPRMRTLYESLKYAPGMSRMVVIRSSRWGLGLPKSPYVTQFLAEGTTKP